MFGIMMSEMMMSGVLSKAVANPSLPSLAVKVSNSSANESAMYFKICRLLKLVNNLLTNFKFLILQFSQWKRNLKADYHVMTSSTICCCSVLLRNPQKHIEMGIRCSLENFGTFASPDGKKIDIIPLYAISNLFAEK